MTEVFHGDCRDVLELFVSNSFDAVITDPPYHLKFMGKAWDGGDVAFQPDTWRTVLRVLKPGAHMLCFGGTRTFHRLACAIEDAGFEIRDTLCWLYGSGFPKSRDVSKAMDKAAGATREVVGVKPGHENFIGRDNHPLNGGWDRPWASDPEAVARYHALTAPATDAARQWQGWGTALKPAYEPIILARKPLVGTVAANVLAHGTGGLNIDVCRIGTTKRVPGSLSKTPNKVYGAGLGGYAQNGTEGGHDPNLGRWPANVVHDGSPEVEAAFAVFETHSAGAAQPKQDRWADQDRSEGWGNIGLGPNGARFGDSGTPSRFFYSAKATKYDRADSLHPTVKPVALLRWLTRMVIPPGGTVLDPFAGSGTLADACATEGFDVVLIEQDAKYIADINRRVLRIEENAW
jgi:site-specific DNA-methyltransferase (adenine-specific)